MTDAGSKREGYRFETRRTPARDTTDAASRRGGFDHRNHRFERNTNGRDGQPWLNSDFYVTVMYVV
ncbi:hypothetical protein [Natrarchaeobius chitinivorans]|uniref:Uncharacterized protein n=1 Tax=Natrarchaeobius chitinivorans TaxID=1679083 RepID=A0A3N6LWP0_NATCH|nr:hypothetical protein [Natrarchaeobius chitinivorans]RQG92124.1 hypothetical protein EA473_17890 [Natrarchaeobius chitinivorans]